jgi:large subunit ribosomal protein L10
MDRTEKEQQISAIKAGFTGALSVIAADYRGITVPSVTHIRDEFRKVGCSYRVLKNTLVKIALKDSPMAALGKLLSGPTALIWSLDSPTAPAKTALRIAKEQEKFVIKGGYFEGQVLDVAGVNKLATMPGKPELQASLLMTFLAAPTDFVRTIAAGPMNFMYLLQARERALGSGQ